MMDETLEVRNRAHVIQVIGGLTMTMFFAFLICFSFIVTFSRSKQVMMFEIVHALKNVCAFACTNEKTCFFVMSIQMTAFHFNHCCDFEAKFDTKSENS